MTFLADVMLAKLATATGAAGAEAVAMSEVEELHHWLGYKVALDRLLHHCHIIPINGPSYRMKDKR